MARGRMLNKNISKSKKFNSLKDDHSRLLYCLLIPYADRDGRLDGDIDLVKAMIYPRRKDITCNDISKWLSNIAEVGLIQWYEVDGDKYIQVEKFREGQEGLRYDRETKSIIPEASGITPATAGSTPREVEVKVEVEVKENKKEGAAVPALKEAPTLYKSIEQAFLSKTGKFTDYKKEGSGIKGLIKKAENWNPEDPTAFSQQIISTYFKLRQSDKFFGGQPFTPSALNSAGIFDRVMVRLEDKSSQVDPDISDYYKEASA